MVDGFFATIAPDGCIGTGGYGSPWQLRWYQEAARRRASRQAATTGVGNSGRTPSDIGATGNDGRSLRDCRGLHRAAFGCRRISDTAKDRCIHGHNTQGAPTSSTALRWRCLSRKLSRLGVPCLGRLTICDGSIDVAVGGIENDRFNRIPIPRSPGRRLGFASRAFLQTSFLRASTACSSPQCLCDGVTNRIAL